MTGACYVTVGNTNGRRQLDGRVEDEGKMAMLLGEECKSGERSERRVDGCIMEEVRKWWQRQKELG